MARDAALGKELDPEEPLDSKAQNEGGDPGQSSANTVYDRVEDEPLRGRGDVEERRERIQVRGEGVSRGKQESKGRLLTMRGT